jgi:hypothetical protein
VIVPPATGLAAALLPEPGLLDELLHAAVVTMSAAAPARQAVRFDNSRNLTAFTYS